MNKFGGVVSGVAMAMALSGCLSLPKFGAGGEGDGLEAPVAAQETSRAKSGFSLFSGKRDAPLASVLDGRFHIGGPKGYCVDPATSRDTAKGAFVIMGHCRALDVKGPKAREAAVITVSIAPDAGPLDEAALDDLAAVLTSEQGRTMLRRSYGGGEVLVEDLERAPGLLLIRAEDGGTSEVTADYWRAVFDLNGALATVTASGLTADPIDAAGLRGLVEATVTKLRALNTGAAEAAS